MKTAVFKVEKENMNRKRYLNVMNSWIKDTDYKLTKDSQIYAISFDGTVQAGASIDIFDENFIKILLLNNSINHQKRINEEATILLTDLLDAEYGRKDKVIQYIKAK